MGSFSIWHWLIVIAVVALLFGGRGKISELMGDVAKGVKSFKKGLADDDDVAQADRAARQRPKSAPRSASGASAESSAGRTCRSVSSRPTRPALRPEAISHV